MHASVQPKLNKQAQWEIRLNCVSDSMKQIWKNKAIPMSHSIKGKWACLILGLSFFLHIPTRRCKNPRLFQKASSITAFNKEVCRLVWLTNIYGTPAMCQQLLHLWGLRSHAPRAYAAVEGTDEKFWRKIA